MLFRHHNRRHSPRVLLVAPAAASLTSYLFLLKLLLITMGAWRVVGAELQAETHGSKKVASSWDEKFLGSTISVGNI